MTRERVRQLAIDAFISASERETNTGDGVSALLFCYLRIQAIFRSQSLLSTKPAQLLKPSRSDETREKFTFYFYRSLYARKHVLIQKTASNCNNFEKTIKKRLCIICYILEAIN